MKRLWIIILLLFLTTQVKAQELDNVIFLPIIIKLQGCNNMNILEISDGITTPLNLLSNNFGFCLNSWDPAIAQVKRGGVFQSSSLSEGRKLVDRKFENVQDTFNFDIKGSGQPETILYVTKLINFLEQATEYWTGNANKVWIKAKADCEDEPRYALIVNYSFPELKFPYGNTFFNATEIASMINVDLGIEHGLWSASIPGESECAETSGIQEWQYTEGWQINTGLPIFHEDALIQTSNGDIYAGDRDRIIRSVDNGANWVVNTVVPASDVVSLLQTANGDIYAGEDGQILRSIDNGASWQVNTVLPVGIVESLLQLTNGDIYAGEDDQIWRSVDNGASWQILTTSPSQSVESLLQTTNGDIYAGNRGQILRSIDNGTSWQINFTTVSNTVSALLQTANGHIYASIADIIYRSIDNGASWQENTTFLVSESLALLQTANGDIYSGDGGRIIRSIDNGASWQIDTTLPTSTISSLLQTANGDIYAGESGQILRFVENTITMGRGSTCTNEVYVSNKQNIANLTHIKIDDGGVFTDIFPSTFPQEFLPTVPVAGDAVYFGIEDIFNGGPFTNLVFDIDEPITFTSNYLIIWEYSDGGAGWPDLDVTDNTDTGDVFRALGVNSVHWEQPSDFAEEAVDGITAFWVRARVFSLTGTMTAPTQQNRDIYTIVLPYAEIATTQVLGNIPALLQQKVQNQSDEDGRGGSAPNLWDNRIISGLRSVDRGDEFQAYINVSDEQNPIGITVTDTGANTAFAADVTTSTGRRATYNPAGVEGMTTQVTIALGSSIARDFYGKFHAFLRAQRTAGNITDFDVQLQFVSGSGGIEFTTQSKQIQTTTQWELLDFGQIQLPVGGTFKSTDLGDITEIRIQASAASGTPNLNMYDLILIPVDEWSIDSIDFANTSDSIVGRDDASPKLLDVDSITNPKIDIQSLVRLTGNEQITSVYDPISPGKAVLQENKQQRLWFLAAQTDQTGIPTAWIAPPEIAHSIQLFKNERYLTFSKGIE